LKGLEHMHEPFYAIFEADYYARHFGELYWNVCTDLENIVGKETMERTLGD